ncbi:hypothetical protein GMLC_05510 [Geomonas limicola]|uniref:OmpA-like domain-containing protein n=1 Tax=Geomonas limicola TaxID=2740186 RepID=A0A6V8N359_9BACT|nr:OmpA family protein [Geomonas limicola]GFO66972.1 hypothetical protein GMLC_05510 [Geomonas limicola]
MLKIFNLLVCLYVIAPSVVFAENTSETIFFVADDLNSAVKYYNSRGEIGNKQFLFNDNYNRTNIMHARPVNYNWADVTYDEKPYQSLKFPNTASYSYLEKTYSKVQFLTEVSPNHYRVHIDGSECFGDGCIMTENIVVAVLPQKFKVMKYDSSVDGTWKNVGNTYSFYSKNVKGASIDIEFEDTVPQVYVDLAKVLANFKDIKVSYDGNNVLVAMPVEGVFNSGEAKIQNNGSQWISIFANTLKSAKIKEMRVEGHSDNVPIKSKLYPSNWELSAARAATVVRYLIGQGLDPKILAAVGYADSKPVSDNDTPEKRKKNRRIEFTIVPKQI